MNSELQNTSVYILLKSKRQKKYDSKRTFNLLRKSLNIWIYEIISPNYLPIYQKQYIFFSFSSIFTQDRLQIFSTSNHVRIQYQKQPLSSHPRYLINSILLSRSPWKHSPLTGMTKATETVSQCRGTNFRNYRDARNLVGGHVNRKVGAVTGVKGVGKRAAVWGVSEPA